MTGLQLMGKTGIYFFGYTTTLNGRGRVDGKYQQLLFAVET
jgi:hypothetical protein